MFWEHTGNNEINRDAWHPASQHHCWHSVPSALKGKKWLEPWWMSRSIYFLKEKVLYLKARATCITQIQMTRWILYWNDNESNYIANCQLKKKNSFGNPDTLAWATRIMNIFIINVPWNSPTEASLKCHFGVITQ